MPNGDTESDLRIKDKKDRMETDELELEEDDETEQHNG